MGKCHGGMPGCGRKSRNKDSYCLPYTTAKRTLGQVMVNRRSLQDVTIAAAAKKPRLERSEDESRLLNRDAWYSLVEMRHKARAETMRQVWVGCQKVLCLRKSYVLYCRQVLHNH
jgi:hypothetical protein